MKHRDLILSVDRNGLVWATELRRPVMNAVMRLSSRAGDWDAWTVILGTLLLSGKQRASLARFVLPRILGSLILCEALKRIARRERPSVAVEGFSSLISDPDPYSFPSAHAATTWAACISAARFTGNSSWLLIFYAALVSYSRVHVGAHYPLDVFAGAGVGTVVGFL